MAGILKTDKNIQQVKTVTGLPVNKNDKLFHIGNRLKTNRAQQGNVPLLSLFVKTAPVQLRFHGNYTFFGGRALRK